MISSLLRRHKQQATGELKNRKPDMVKGSYPGPHGMERKKYFP
jgi:hypothetical protein